MRKWINGSSKSLKALKGAKIATESLLWSFSLRLTNAWKYPENNKQPNKTILMKVLLTKKTTALNFLSETLI